MTHALAIVAGGAELLDRIEPFWRELRVHHADLTDIWRDSILQAGWLERRAGLIEKSKGGHLVVLLASLADGARIPVAYCVCTITAAGQGEVDSLYVSPAHRRARIGHALMTRATEWLASHHADPIIVDVLAANGAAVRFYEQLGFHPRTITMRRP